MAWSATPPPSARDLSAQIAASQKPEDYGGIFPRWQFSNTPNSHISKWAPMGWGQWPGITGGPDWARGGGYGGAGPQMGWSAPNGQNAGGGGGYGNITPGIPGGLLGTGGQGGGSTQVPGQGGGYGGGNPGMGGGTGGGNVGTGGAGGPPMSNPLTDGFSHPSAGPNGTQGWQALVTKMYGGSDPIAALQKAIGTTTTKLGFGGPNNGPSTMTQANLSNLNTIRANLQANGMDAYTAAKIAEAFGSKGQGALDAANALGIGSQYSSMGGLIAPQSNGRR